MATVRYGDVVQANESNVSLEDKLKKRRASLDELEPQNSAGADPEIETSNKLKKESA